MSRVRRSLRRVTGATVVGVLLWGAAGASAAPVGGSGNVRAGGGLASIGTCQSGSLSLAYVNTWSVSLSRFQTTVVRVHGITSPACNGKTIHVNLRNSSNVSLASGSASIAASTVDVPVDSPSEGCEASLVAGASVIVLG